MTCTTHEPIDYVCPFCQIIQGKLPAEIVHENETVIAFLSLQQFPNNPGNTLIVPKAHHENLYDLPVALGSKVFEASQRVAIAMKVAFGCDGVSTRQHNEPAGYQDVWHYHVHVTPRFTNDHFYSAKGIVMPADERGKLARLLSAAMNRQP